VLAEFKTPLNFQPDYFVMSDDEQFAIIATPDDAIYFNRLTSTEIDLDELHKIAMLKCMIYDGEARSFYILANKFEEKLGIFLIVIKDNDPAKISFKLLLKNQLDMSDCNMNVFRCESANSKELIISYKTIYINIFTTMVLDLSNS
jgi:hypothetical protein